MMKFFIFLSLFFYTLALVLGLILYFSLDRRDLMTAGEVIGYATITKPEAEDIQRLTEQVYKLENKRDVLESEIFDKNTKIKALNTQMTQLQREVDTLAAEKQKYQKGRALATDLLAMKPQQVVTTLAEIDDTTLEFFVSYVMPFMRNSTKYGKLMDAMGKTNPILTAKIETLVAVEEERMSQEKKALQ